MLRRLLALPGPVVWLFLVLAVGFSAGAWFAEGRANLLARNGVDTTAEVTRKYEHRYSVDTGRRSEWRTVNRIDYTYALPDGRRLEGWKDLKQGVWDKIEVGQPIKIRYALQDPGIHETGDGEYTEAAQTLSILGFFALALAGFFFGFDIKNAIPWSAAHLRKLSTGLAAGGLVFLVASAIAFWRGGLAGEGVATARAIIFKLEAAAAGTSDAIAGGKSFAMTYRFRDDRGTEQTFTRTISKDEYERRRLGEVIPVRYALNDSSVHDVRSAEMAEIGAGFTIFGALLLLVAVPFAWRDIRRLGSAPPPGRSPA